MHNKYDFAGWVTKKDIVCADGLVIRHDAFKENDGTRVPLVWQHNYNSPTNVLGHVILEARDEGVYGYGYLNKTEDATHAKEMIRHGDITSMSIGAKKLKKMANNLIHGTIYEVSLVLSGANPGAVIETFINHSEDGEEFAEIYPGVLMSEPEEETIKHEEGDEDPVDDDKTIGEIMDTMNEEQRSAVEALLGGVIEDLTSSEESLTQSDIENGGEEHMKHNVFTGVEEQETLTHDDIKAIMSDANDLGTLKKSLLQHGITGIEALFPEAKNLTAAPVFFKDDNTGAKSIISAMTKSPFSKIKTMFADLTEDEARARGYIKGEEKLEQVFSLLERETHPQTIYKKQKLDRDDIIDITDFDVVAWMNTEMRFMLEEEIARAALVGDGRETTDDSKIKADRIRPIITDDDFYTLKRTYNSPRHIIEVVIKAMADYKGLGSPTMYIDPMLLAELRLLTAEDGRYLFGDIPSPASIAAKLGVKEIVPTTLMTGKGALIVNLSDYHLGSTKGGEVTTFEDFDIDFNKHKYLIETRLSGALTKPHSAIYLSEAAGTPGGGE